MLLATFALIPRWLPRSAPPVRLVLVYDDTATDVLAGASMSAAEVARVAPLLRREFIFDNVTAAEFSGTGTSATGLILATAAPFDLPAGLPVIDALGSTPRRCAEQIHHLSPSARMREAAPGAVVWHASLFRYGASQLNDRFRAAGVEPTAGAWAGWFGVKALWESQLRDTPLTKMLFDGHKGRPLTFDPASRALLQPLYQIDGARVTNEWSPPDDFEDLPCVTP